MGDVTADTLERPPHSGTSLSFAGCGFLGIYHLGVAQALIRHGSRFLRQVDYYAGASAGSLVAAALAIKGPDLDALQECTEFCLDLAARVQRQKMGVLAPSMSLLRPLQEFLEHMLPPGSHVTATGRLFVSVTKSRSRKNVLVSQYESREQLIQYLLASSYIPHLTGKQTVRVGDKKFWDGGMTDNLPRLNDMRTVSVSPFAGNQDICPLDESGQGKFVKFSNQHFQVNTRNIRRGIHALFPPKKQHLYAYLEQGYEDAVRFLQKDNCFEDDGMGGILLPLTNATSMTSLSTPSEDRKDSMVNGGPELGLSRALGLGLGGLGLAVSVSHSCELLNCEGSDLEMWCQMTGAQRRGSVSCDSIDSALSGEMVYEECHCGNYPHSNQNNGDADTEMETRTNVIFCTRL